MMSFVECEIFSESCSPEVLTLFKVNLDEAVDSAIYCVNDLPDPETLQLIYMVWLLFKEGLPLVLNTSLKNLIDTYSALNLTCDIVNSDSTLRFSL